MIERETKVGLFPDPVAASASSSSSCSEPSASPACMYMDQQGGILCEDMVRLLYSCC